MLKKLKHLCKKSYFKLCLYLVPVYFSPQNTPHYVFMHTLCFEYYKTILLYFGVTT